MQIFVFLWPMWNQEQGSLSDSRTFQSQGGGKGGKQRKHKKKHAILAFKPLLKEIRLQNLTLSESFSEALTPKLWNKIKTHAAKTYRNGAKLHYIPPYGFIKNLQLIHLRENHVKITGKNKVDNIIWAKLCSLIGQK